MRLLVRVVPLELACVGAFACVAGAFECVALDVCETLKPGPTCAHLALLVFCSTLFVYSVDFFVVVTVTSVGSFDESSTVALRAND